jgi:DNA-binding transcriptional regulator YdaS (Cro superfamily)
MSIKAITSAVQVLGSQTNLAKKLNCTPQNVQHMCATGHVPAKHVLKIEAATGVSRNSLRPDLYPDHSPTLSTNLRTISVSDQSCTPSVHLSSTDQ